MKRQPTKAEAELFWKTWHRAEKISGRWNNCDFAWWFFHTARGLKPTKKRSKP